ncbi:MAG: hypothetical protein LQ349_005215 [Xanthoria aureola]|nr:MAG: hypothetical protein LQ349_005215 [Xanthoria aureola]
MNSMSLGKGGTPPTTEGVPANPDPRPDLAPTAVEDDEQDPAGQRHRFHLPPREGDEAAALQGIIDASLGGVPTAPVGAVLADGRS